MEDREKRLLLFATAGLGLAMAARTVLRKWREFDFTGKTVLITGGSRGLGLLLAEQWAAEGARVAICARDAQELERASQRLASQGAEATTVACDLTDRSEVERMVDEVRAALGPIDVLVNNAGTIQVGPQELMTTADFEEAMRLHFWAPLYAIQAVLPDMKARKAGRIVNISSIGGKVSVPHLLPYSASKFALTGLSEGLRSELVRHGIFVTTVCPGLMRTGSPVNAQFKGNNKAEFTLFKLLDSLPLTSVDARGAARQIVDACRYGDAELVLSQQAKVAATLHNVFPGATADALGLLSRVLPGAKGKSTASVPGEKSETSLSNNALTRLNDEAARELNQN